MNDKFIKWDEESGIATPVTLKADPNGFYIYWVPQNSEIQFLDVATIRDARTGKYARVPKEAKLRNLVDIGTDPLEDKTVTIVWGTELVNVNFYNFCCSSKERAQAWTNHIMKIAYNIYGINACQLTSLQKAHTKLTLMIDRDGKLPVRQIIKMFAQHKDDRKRIERALDALNLPSTKHETIHIDKFGLDEFVQFYRNLVQRHEIEAIFDQLYQEALQGHTNTSSNSSSGGGRSTSLTSSASNHRDGGGSGGGTSSGGHHNFIGALSGHVGHVRHQAKENQAAYKDSKHGKLIHVDSLVNFVNKHQRDPRLNEILYPYADRQRGMDLIMQYEPNKEVARRSYISVNGFLRYLMSDDNAIVAPDKFDLTMDMTQPLNHYFINSSHNTYLTGHQLTGKSSVEMYRQCLLAGCRCIELDCWNGRAPDEEPIITHGYTVVTEISLIEVLEAINESAFKTSPYPVILSFENHCSPKQQAKMVNYCKKIFGDLLLTDPLPDYPLTQNTLLPSPQALLRRIIIKNKKKHHKRNKKYLQEISTASPQSPEPSLNAANNSCSQVNSNQTTIQQPSATNTSSSNQSQQTSQHQSTLTPQHSISSSTTSGIETYNSSNQASSHVVIKASQTAVSVTRSNDSNSSSNSTSNSATTTHNYYEFNTNNSDTTSPIARPTDDSLDIPLSPTTPTVATSTSTTTVVDIVDNENKLQQTETSFIPSSRSSSTVAACDIEELESDDSDPEEEELLPPGDISNREDLHATVNGEHIKDDDLDLANQQEISIPPVSKEAEPAVEMSALVVYIQPVRFKSFEEAERRGRSYEVSSFDEKAATSLLKERPIDFVSLNKKQLTRIYPRGTRVDSSNYMPQVFWNAGCQMVALNFQTLDLGMQLNQGIFDYNSRSGYLLKPEFMRRSDRSFDPFTESTVDGIIAGTVNIKVISGQFLSDKRVGTYVEVEMYGLPADTVRKRRTKIVPANGINPVYDDEPFTFKKVVLPDLASLRIAAFDDSGKCIGYRILPLVGLRPGYRHLSLRNESNQPLSLPTLFVKIEVNDYVPDTLSELADALANPIAHQSMVDRHAKQLMVFADEADTSTASLDGTTSTEKSVCIPSQSSTTSRSNMTSISSLPSGNTNTSNNLTTTTFQHPLSSQQESPEHSQQPVKPGNPKRRTMKRFFSHLVPNKPPSSSSIK